MKEIHFHPSRLVPAKVNWSRHYWIY